MSDVKFNELSLSGGFKIGLITLDRPQALNALSLEMFVAIKAHLLKWSDQDELVAVVIDSSSSKSFCAGGDVKKIVQTLNEKRSDVSMAASYFSNEYYVDYLIRTFKKPIVCWAQGIVMGGGLGIMNGCSHRIVCENSVLAMPEVNIGFFPDVGASYFLNQLPKGVGLFMGLTAAKLSGADALSVSLADYYIPNLKKSEVMEKLSGLKWSADLDLNKKYLFELLEEYSDVSVVGQSELMDRLEEIQELMDQDTLKDLDSVLREWEPLDEYFKACKKTYEEGSPTTINIFYEIMRKPLRDLQQVYLRDWNVALKICIQRTDFCEGVRAVLIDKDNDPRWRPSRLAKVKDVANFFNDIPDLDNTLKSWLLNH